MQDRLEEALKQFGNGLEQVQKGLKTLDPLMIQIHQNSDKVDPKLKMQLDQQMEKLKQAKKDLENVSNSNK